MKVIFERVVSDICKTDLIVQKANQSISISIKFTNNEEESKCKTLNHNLTKDELKEYIGALLHIQAKMRK